MVGTLGIVWGATFLVIELALAGISPAWLAAGRVTLAATLTLVIWIALTGGRLWSGRDRNWPGLCLIGALSTAVPYLCLAWAQTHVSSGLAGVSMAAIALIVLPLSHFALPDAKMTWRSSAGLCIGFVGVMILIGGGAFRSTGDPLEPLGRLACLGAALSYSVSSVTMRRLPPADPLGLAAVPLLIGSCMIVPLALLLEGPPPLPAPETLGWIALLGFVPTAGANLLRVLVIRRAGPVFMSLTNYQVPCWSVIFGIVILDEPVEAKLFLALALILSGIGISQWPALRRTIMRR
ncbi:membrane protein [Roseivivax halodurans JCM 10272]|uniref:Membrane protein n=1 Tax=Roseivivax halodurans JCM 10272 TaxID=1449350 RepID=X7EKM5_9RHOB|nr:DMT family transporter [Roseivivax halodurans]ETX16654.1 membrane protein [Roseivivax halodurans JCM 10272]